MNSLSDQKQTTSVSNPPVVPIDQITVPEYPVVFEDVKLVGMLQGAGFAQQQWLIQRDGKFIQLSELLYKVVELSNGKRSLEDIAATMTEQTEYAVTAEHVRALLKKLIPMGIIADGSEDLDEETELIPPQSSAPVLGLNIRAKVIGPNIIDPIARVLQFLYIPPVLVPILIAIAAVHGWLYFSHGISRSFSDILYRPWAFPIILLLLIIAGIIHEFGHAAALRYGGGQVRGMGVGIYLIYPAFYSDVTDSYRLGRWERVRTDLGGFYFYLVYTLIITGLYFITRQEFLLFTIVLINLDILYQLLPFVRMDGYWALADLTGIPDFLSQLGPFLASTLRIPGWKGAKLPQLKRWVRIVFLVYAVLVIPLLIIGLFLALTRLPRLIISTWDSFLYQIRVFGLAQNRGDVPGMVILIFSMLLLMIMAVGSIYLFYMVSRTVGKGLWSLSLTGPKRRLSSAVLSVALVAIIAYFWMPYVPYFTHSAPPGVKSYVISSRNHVQTKVNYPQSPPVGGDHSPILQNCGYYDTPVASENAVHSLEHGAVWIIYSSNLPADQVQALRQMAYQQIYVIVSPNPDNPAPIVASAWGKQLYVNSQDDPRLDQFVRAFRLSKQAPESGEPCKGGIGNPK